MKKSNAMKVEMDRISELPEGIFLNIISRLTLKEAAATSLISTRWTDLWKFYSGCFDFDGSDTVRDIRKQWIMDSIATSTLVRKRRNFVDWVNHVLRSHQGGTMERLRVIFDLQDSSPEVIDTWVQLALAKRVQFIELDLTSFYSFRQPSIEYDFPVHSHCGSQSLKSLVLSNVNISGDALESLVDKCPNLENLSITCSYSTEVFKLSSLSLKQLTLWSCHPLFDIKISAPNLLSFAWAGSEDSNLVLQDVPRIYDYFDHIQSHHSQLVTLELDDFFATFPQNQWNIGLPEFSNLRHLTMTLYFFDGDHTFPFIVAYIKAAPLLEKFTLEVHAQREDGELSEEAALNMAMNHCYKNLKSVEFQGFGKKRDVEFIRYLRNHAPLLEKIVIDLCPPRYLGSPAETGHRLTTEYLEARNCAINFGASLDSHVTVV